MKRITLILAITVSACTDAAAPPPTSTFEPDYAAARSTGSTTLPTFGGGGRANAINDAGIVVGIAGEEDVSRYQGGRFYPAKWVRDPVTAAWAVSVLGGDSAEALALNEAGDAVGVGGGKARVWLASGHEDSLGAGAARGINDAGIIVGGSAYGCPSSSVCSASAWVPSTELPNVWTQVPLTLLEEGGSAEAIAINNNGAIAGAATRGGLFRAVVWYPIPGGGWSAPIPREGTDASTGTSAGFAINDDGDVVGYARTCPPQTCNGRPYLWPAGGGSFDLGRFNPAINVGRSSAISAEGQVAGWVGVTRGPGEGPFLWQPGTTSLVDLGSGEAHGINDRTAAYGQEVVGWTRARSQMPAVWRVQ